MRLMYHVFRPNFISSLGLVLGWGSGRLDFRPWVGQLSRRRKLELGELRSSSFLHQKRCYTYRNEARNERNIFVLKRGRVVAEVGQKMPAKVVALVGKLGKVPPELFHASTIIPHKSKLS